MTTESVEGVPGETDGRAVRITVGSLNPVKIAAVREAAGSFFTRVAVASVKARSGVGAQPLSDEEAIRGAVARARQAREETGAELGVGIESGVGWLAERCFGCTWVAVAAEEGALELASSARFPLPSPIAVRIRAGEEMTTAMDAWSGRTGVGRREGAAGVLSGGRVTRRETTVQALCFAFAALRTGPDSLPTRRQGHRGDLRT